MPDIVIPRAVIIVGTALVVVGLMVFFAALVVGYIGDEYASPAFSESSVPPSRAH
jgi:hypothetical protein